MKYIETELKKKKGLVEAEEQKVKVKNAEDHLYELPESIRVNSAKKTEEMLSNQMLSGIPEVDLGIEYVEKSLSYLCIQKYSFLLCARTTVLHCRSLQTERMNNIHSLSFLSQCKDKEHYLYRGSKSQAAGRTEEQEERQWHIICTHQYCRQLRPAQPL